MIYATGDTHGDFQRFTTKNFPEQKEMSREDYVIICGDFGGVWADSPKEQYWLNWLEDKPFTTLLVDGNHENFDRLNALPVKEWHGSKIYEIRPHIYHLMHGQVFDIRGYKFFAMGGAASHDIRDGILDPADPDFEQTYWRMRRMRRMRQMFRVRGVSWWDAEMPSQAEYEEAKHNLENANWQVDFILSHCAPTSIQQKIDPDFVEDALTDFHQMVKQECDFRYWLFGHYHDNKKIDEKYILLWEQIVRVA